MGCPEVMYGAYYPYLYGRAAGGRAGPAFASPFSAHQYDRDEGTSKSSSVLRSPSRHLAEPLLAPAGSALLAPGGSASLTPAWPRPPRVSVDDFLGPSMFNVQSSQPLSQEVYGAGAGAGLGPAGGSAGSVSSGGGPSPAGSPPRPAQRLRAKEEDLSLHGRTSAEAAGAADEEDDDSSCQGAPGGSRAQYVSANCVVFTHYSGDVASVVDEHFTRALGCADKNTPGTTKESSPMSSRNFPPSFWNSQYQAAPTASELYADPYHAHAAHAAHHAHAAHDPWASHYQQYTAAAHHHRAVQEYHHHHNTMAQYGGLLLPTRLPHHAQYKPPVDWSASHTSRLHDQAGSAHHGHAHALDTSAYSSYPTMAGLEAQVQESSKDLYWF